MSFRRKLWEFGQEVVDKFKRDRCMQSASSLTTTTLFALVPLITFSLDLFALFPEFRKLGKAVSGFLLSNLLPDAATRVVATYATQFSGHAAQLTYLGLAMLMGTVFSLILTVDHTFNAIWGTAPRRPLHQRLVIYGGLILFGPLLFGLGLWGMTLLVRISIGWAGESARTLHMMLKFLSFLVMVAGLALAYYKVPDHPVRWRHALFGGVIGSLLFEGMKSGFAWFIAHISSYTLIYGAFAAVPIFLAWIHMSWAVILFAAVVTACLPQWEKRR
ncbi:MAG: YihY family inner membrane protein [Ferrovum sp.]|nr:YihY family inner membrane protein [Ferrovum sp.]NDU86730.1 YihY family inner membrane protein [Ferrovum sp.]